MRPGVVNILAGGGFGNFFYLDRTDILIWPWQTWVALPT